MSCMKTYLPILMAIGATVMWQSRAMAQCPAVGDDTDCGVVITITSTGASVTSTGQGPYDGIEDTLIGVVNNSNIPVTSIDLKSGLAIFSFDGDGIDAYGVGGNADDSTGYGGPDAYFSMIGGDQRTGRVNFITPIAAHGGTGYFSLEYAISSATACTSVLNKSLSKPAGGGTQIQATFTPQLGYSLAQAAKLCGFIEFDWQQTITSLPLPSPFFAAGSTVALHAPPPFNDPPPNGYAYQNPPNAVELPVYYNLFTSAPDPLSLPANETSTTLSFYDAPADSCLFGGSGAPCGGKTAPKGAVLGFTTHLVGIQGKLPGATVVDTGIGFSWTDSFNGTSGGISVTNSAQPVDPGSGTGGIVVTGVSEISTLSGVSVTAVNGTPVSGAGAPTLPSGDACNGTYSGTFDGNVRVSAGQSCTLLDGTVNGNVLVKGGSLTLAGTWVNGNLLVHGAAALTVGDFSAIEGNVEINGLRSGAADQVCSSTVYGNLLIHDNAAPLDIGSAPSSPSPCLGNVLGSNVEIQNNSGATAVYGNTVTNVLACDNNSSIVGGSNSASIKQGQCSAF